MKTTVEIGDALFQRAKERCARDGLTMRQLMELGLRLALEPPRSTVAFRLGPFGFGGEGARTQDWATIREMAYEGRGGAVTGEGSAE
jgi:hypothetical protein